MLIVIIMYCLNPMCSLPYYAIYHITIIFIIIIIIIIVIITTSIIIIIIIIIIIVNSSSSPPLQLKIDICRRQQQ